MTDNEPTIYEPHSGKDNEIIIYRIILFFS